ncbi:DUF2971 domain-containing protein [Afipia sp. GAS231]|uniref:DUF2971 domain-containing protein n=1 Tax=Afipia sp. GAS231 TaxID=1882747 RepID=UPI00087B483D|nr:DUF2971 domain-containing protein [Afipia sp. GAS231]SDO64049.1 Protein of unknown function [Afipia sp. GAS231]
MTLYKYYPPNRYSLENLRRHSFYCRHYTDFNDPFEFWCNISSGIPDRNAEPNRFRAAVAEWGFPDGEPHDEEDCRAYFESLVDAAPDFQTLMDHVRIACFASAPDNLLMWSHYADGMRGFCAEFDDALVQKADERVFLTPVEYVEAPQHADSFVYAVAEDQWDFHGMCVYDHDRGAGGAISAPERDSYEEASLQAHANMTAIWRRVFATKPVEWRYEGEQRLLLQATDGGAEPVQLEIPVEALRGIIMGERMDYDYRKQLEVLLASQYPRVPIRRATRSADRYTIELTGT